MPDETALLLTQQEWDDLAWMCSFFRQETHYVDEKAPDKSPELNLIRRQRVLALKIIDAANA